MALGPQAGCDGSDWDVVGGSVQTTGDDLGALIDVDLSALRVGPDRRSPTEFARKLGKGYLTLWCLPDML